MGSIPGQRAKIPHASGQKTKQNKTKQNMNNKSDIITNSIKTLKMVHIKKSFKRKNIFYIVVKCVHAFIYRCTQLKQNFPRQYLTISREMHVAL